MNDSPSVPPADLRKSLRAQGLVLLGVAVVAFIVAWLDGLSGFIDIIETIRDGQETVMVRMRWFMSFSLPLVSVVALTLAAIGHFQQRLFDVKPLVVCGAVTVSAVIMLGVGAIIGFDRWIEKHGYEPCTSLDRVQGVTRHGTRNVEVAAWTPIGRCPQ